MVYPRKLDQIHAVILFKINSEQSAKNLNIEQAISLSYDHQSNGQVEAYI